MKGHLVIGGGNIKSNIIYKEFLKYVGNGKIGIIPTASPDFEETLLNFKNIFQQLGVQKQKIVAIKLNPDNASCTDYAVTGDDFDSFEFMNNITGIWFTGGDQIRIIRALLRKDGTKTKLLYKIKEILDNGGVIGGSSAGAAIMSEVMIGGGTSYGSLINPTCYDYLTYRKYPEMENSGILLITKGLGFFKEGLVDQHFEERHRILRLLRALAQKNISKGYGISEDTALVYDILNKQIKCIGTGGITILNIVDSAVNQIDFLKVRISYLNKNDCYNNRENKIYIDGANEITNIDDYQFKNCNLYEDIGCKIKLYCDKTSKIFDNGSFNNVLMDTNYIGAV